LKPAPVEAGPAVPVTIFSDYICPFCYIGDRRLRRLEERFDLRVERRFLEIHPETPATGRPVSDLGYPPERWRRMMANLALMARSENIALAERRITTNSRRALLLAEAAKEEGEEIFRALNESIFYAFFCEGKNIGDTSVLRALAANAGVRPEIVDRAWRAPVYEERLDENRRVAARSAISGVPTYLIGDRLLVGAVATASLLEACRKVQAGLGG
jgi:predicted DsbA family dithiol-disulfide isomerase